MSRKILEWDDQAQDFIDKGNTATDSPLIRLMNTKKFRRVLRRHLRRDAQAQRRAKRQEGAC